MFSVELVPIHSVLFSIWCLVSSQIGHMAVVLQYFSAFLYCIIRAIRLRRLDIYIIGNISSFRHAAIILTVARFYREANGDETIAK